jgi:ELWxxDGT repeat protein
VGKTLYFRAFDALHGSEIWKSDGTSEGTLLVLDVNSGSDGSVVGCLANCQRGASPWGIALEGVLFFNAFDNTTGLELWRTDGSPQGTRLVKDIFPGEGGSFPGEARGVKSLLYFAATDELHGTELWKSDGTPEGTVLIKDVEPGGAGSYPSDLVELNGRLFFLASDGVGQYRPWVSDGTDAGTIPLTGPSFRLPADSGLRPGRHALPAKAGGTLFFAVEGFPQLWRTDGTPEGTAQVPDLASWLGNPSSLEPLSVRGQLFVLVAYPWGEKTLWKITEEADLTFDQVASDPCLRIWLALDGTLLFTTGCGARALWISNGTLEGTLMLEEFTAVQSPGENFTRAGETLFFSLSDPVHGNELWSMDLSEILEQWDTRLPIHRGDPNSSGTTDIADGVTIFGFLFLGDPPALSCRESADSNNDGTIDISDGIYLLNWLFTGGPEPATPGPTGAPCGVDPDGEGSPGDLGCTEYPPCQ